MEKFPGKINELSPVLIKLIGKIQSLESTSLTKEQKEMCTKEILEEVDKLHNFIKKALSCNTDDSFKMIKEKIERAFSQFEWNVNVAVIPNNFSKYSENGKMLISSILKVLGRKGCGILIIETYLKFCVKVVEISEIPKNINFSVDIMNFKALLEGFSFAANMIKKYWHVAFSQNQKHSIMLCFNQICKFLPFLLKMITAKNNEIKKYTLKVIKKCLNRILQDIHCDGNSELNNCDQEFITLMNFCLHKLNDLSENNSDFSSFIQKANETFENLKPVINEILCTVMSISQVIHSKSDYEIILKSSLKVLKENSDLSNDIKNENSYGIKINACSIGESLCFLESVVNNAVLKLILEVFSGTKSPLKSIVNKCRTDIAKNDKTPEDLNILISDFDVDMDRIMQIGLFAISCSFDVKRVLGIRSCLASLESLESELIPSLTALYVDCNSNNKAKFQFLLDFWLSEITELKTLIDSVVDPIGFCQVVYNEVKTLALNLKDDLGTQSITTNKFKSTLKQIIRYSRKLIRTLQTSMQDEKCAANEVDDYIRNFQLGVQECEAIFDLIEKTEENISETTTQALKRCDFLLEKLEKLHMCLQDLLSDVNYENKQEETLYETDTKLNIKFSQENFYKLCESPCVTGTTPDTKDLEILTPYINQGILRSKKRDFFYGASQNEKKSEKKIESAFQKTDYWCNTPVSRKRSHYCKSLNLDLEIGNTIDLEITTVLENLTDLSNTFSESLNNVKLGKPDARLKKQNKRKDQNIDCGTETNSDCEISKYTSRGCCTDFEFLTRENETDDKDKNEQFLGDKIRNQFKQSLIELTQNDSLSVPTDNTDDGKFDTPERMNDLEILEERINFLKQQVPYMLP